MRRTASRSSSLSDSQYRFRSFGRTGGTAGFVRRPSSPVRSAVLALHADTPTGPRKVRAVRAGTYQDPDHFRASPWQKASPTTVSAGQNECSCCTTSRRRTCLQPRRPCAVPMPASTRSRVRGLFEIYDGLPRLRFLVRIAKAPARLLRATLPDFCGAARYRPTGRSYAARSRRAPPSWSVCGRGLKPKAQLHFGLGTDPFPRRDLAIDGRARATARPSEAGRRGQEPAAVAHVDHLRAVTPNEPTGHRSSAGEAHSDPVGLQQHVDHVW
ncbi:hypothetical protein EDE04_0863 [Streptomyces sp. 2132.2]|nr:hypothetical protein EDE04_0863 [Streptomyces sp. 2132.2]